MELNKTDWELVQHTVDQWVAEGKLDLATGDMLKKDVTIKRSERQLIAQYFFIIALSCILLAFGAIFIDDKLLEKIKHYFALSDLIIAVFTGAICVGWFWYVQRIKNKLSPLGYEIYMVLGALAALTTMVYVCKDVSAATSYTLLFILAALLLFMLSIFFKSKALWISAMIALLCWYGSFTSDHSTLYLFMGMNYAVRFTIFGLLLLLFSFGQRSIPSLSFTQRITYVFGLLVFFAGMWAVSIFGNFGSFDEWIKVRQTSVLAYSVVFAFAGGIAFYLGLRYKDELTRDMGVLFLLINLYTRYFEFFWDNMNKGLFFLILAVTFGLLGRWLERKKRPAKNKVI